MLVHVTATGSFGLTLTPDLGRTARVRELPGLYVLMVVQAMQVFTRHIIRDGQVQAYRVRNLGSIRIRGTPPITKWSWMFHHIPTSQDRLILVCVTRYSHAMLSRNSAYITCVATVPMGLSTNSITPFTILFLASSLATFAPPK